MHPRTVGSFFFTLKLALALGPLGSSVASACTCSGAPMAALLAPADAPLPRNAHVWVRSHPGVEAVVLCGMWTTCSARGRLVIRRAYATGEKAPPDVEVSVRRFPNETTTLIELVPDHLLEPDALHEVWWEDPAGVAPARILGLFTTDATVDTTAPAWTIGPSDVWFHDPAFDPPRRGGSGCSGGERVLRIEGDLDRIVPSRSLLVGVWLGAPSRPIDFSRPPTYVLAPSIEMKRKPPPRPVPGKPTVIELEDFVIDGPGNHVDARMSEPADCVFEAVTLPPRWRTARLGLRLFDLAGNASVPLERDFSTGAPTRARPAP